MNFDDDELITDVRRRLEAIEEERLNPKPLAPEIWVSTLGLIALPFLHALLMHLVGK